MSNWKELSDKEKVRLILEHVLQWPHANSYEALEEVCHGKGYPVAFWEPWRNHWLAFHEVGEHAKIFDPLHVMSDAWIIVERITQPPQTSQEAAQGANIRFISWWKQSDLWASTGPEAANEICLAALSAIGLCALSV